MVDLSVLSFNRKEKAILEGIRRHLEAVEKTVNAFADAVGAAARGDAGSAMKLIQEVFQEETRADGIHRDLSLKVAEGAFFGGVREDILDLLEKIDNIADSAKDSARLLLLDASIEKEGREILQSQNLAHFLQDLKSSVGALSELVASFDRGKKEILSKVHGVEEFEEEADSDKEKVLEELFSRGSSMNPVTVIQLRDFIFIADDVADSAEDASDVILVLVAKGYG